MVLWVRPLLILLFLSLPPLGQAHPAQAVDWFIEDPPDDVTVGDGNVDAPKGSVDWADLRELRITEESDGVFQIAVRFKDFDFEPTADAGEVLYLFVDFALKDQDISYRIQHVLYGARDTSTTQVTFRVNPLMTGPPVLCVGRGERVTTTPCSGFPITVTTKPETEVYEYRIAKHRLAQARPTGITTGADTLGKWHIGEHLLLGAQTIYYSGFGFLEFQDAVYAPADKTYELRHDAPNDRIILHLDPPGADQLFYRPGDNQTLIFHVSNREPTRQLVRIAYGLAGDDSERTKFSVAGPSALSVPANQNRSYQFYLQSVDTAQTPVVLWIRADAVGSTWSGYDEATLRTGEVLGPDLNRLRFFGLTHEAPEVRDLCGDIIVCTTAGTFSSLDAIAGWDYPRVTLYPSYDNALWAHRHLSQPIALGADKARIQLHIDSGTVAEPDVTIKTELFYQRPEEPRITLFSGSQEKTLEPDGTEVTFDLPLKTKQRVLGAHGRLGLVIRLEPGETATFAPHVNVRESGITLPLVAVPEEFLQRPTPTPFQLTVPGEREEFVNPGKHRLFNFTVFNQDSVEQRLRLKLSSTLPWENQLLPADEFQLRPGDSVALGVLVRAPEGAREGDRTTITVNATDDQGTSIGTKLVVTVVSSVDLSDDKNAYRLDDDDRDKIVSEPAGRASALGPAAVVAMLLFGWRRRS